MVRTIYDNERYYDITDKPKKIGKCEICECAIYEDMEHYDFIGELTCIDCKDTYVNNTFYRI